MLRVEKIRFCIELVFDALLLLLLLLLVQRSPHQPDTTRATEQSTEGGGVPAQNCRADIFGQYLRNLLKLLLLLPLLSHL